VTNLSHIPPKLPLPDIIVLFGPPASGKGTQANLLADKYQEYIHFDFGSNLREFINKQLGDYASISQEKLEQLQKSSDTEVQAALRARAKMLHGQPVNPDDLWHIVGNQLQELLNQGKKVIVEGIGRTYEDGYRFGHLTFEHKLSVCIFHLHVTLEQSIKRSSTRWYTPNSQKPYTSYEQALKHCKPGEEPWQRPEDKEADRVTGRYKLLYSDIFAKVLSTLQMESRGRLFIIDGNDTIEENFRRIEKYLTTFYHQS
jgi:adenylate kinase family enzyme